MFYSLLELNKNLDLLIFNTKPENNFFLLNKIKFIFFL
jgi:hypothetical protein